MHPTRLTHRIPYTPDSVRSRLHLCGLSHSIYYSLLALALPLYSHCSPTPTELI
jgi:hypothetical protein